MSNPPRGANVTCPACDARAVAIIPRGSTVVEEEEAADGKVRVNCHDCGHQFLVHFREKDTGDGG